MRKFKIAKENFALLLIVILSAILNLVNLNIEGTANSYYAAAAKSMTLNFKNFFFVSFDPAGFMSIDKPPLGFWFQAISAKIFGFSGWSIILPQAIAGVISVIVINKIVKKAFGNAAGLLASLFLAVTPVFVAASRNNTIDNTLVLALLFACLALSKAAEKGKLKYLIISLALVGVGFNIKMLQAYMIVPALYITYLLSTSSSVKKRIVHLALGTVVMLVVSLSWAVIVDLVPASSRPYVDSSTNNTVMNLILGHNGAERLSLSSNNQSGGGGPMGGGNMQTPPQFKNSNNNQSSSGNSSSNNNSGNQGFPSGNGNSNNSSNQGGSSSNDNNGNNNQGGPGSNNNNSSNNQGFPDSNGSNTSNQNGSSSNSNNSSSQGFPGGNGGSQGGPGGNGNNGSSQGGPGGNGGNSNIQGGPGGFGGNGNSQGGPAGNGGFGGGSSNLQGSFGGQVKSSITRLFLKNILSDQIVWFIPLAILGFIAAAIKEKLRFRLDNKKKQSLVMWFMWFLPCFIYFSYNTGTFHSYYLTMLAPPTAALASIGIVSMWHLYKEDGWKSWFLPVSLMANGAVQLLMLNYFISSSSIIKVLMILLVILCFGSSIALLILKLIKKKTADEEDQNNNKENKKLILNKNLVAAALVGILITPFIGSAAVLTTKLNGSFPAAGLELLTNSQDQLPSMSGSTGTQGKDSENGGNTKLIEFLQKNKTANQKYLLVVSNSNSASDIIINTGEAVMSLGGFLGSDNAITLDEFKALVKKGEIRYVMTGGQGGSGGQGMPSFQNSQSSNNSENSQNGTGTQVSQNNQISNSNQDNQNFQNTQGGQGFPGGSQSQSSKNSINEILTWVQENGTLVSASEYGGTDTSSIKDNTTTTSETTTDSDNNSQDNTTSTSRKDSQKGGMGGFRGGNSGQLYDLKAYTDSTSTN